MTPFNLNVPSDGELPECLDTIQDAHDAEEQHRDIYRSGRTWRGGCALDTFTEWQYQQERCT